MTEQDLKDIEARCERGERIEPHEVQALIAEIRHLRPAPDMRIHYAETQAEMDMAMRPKG